MSKASSSKSDFLFELGCEELPSAAVLSLSSALTLNVMKILTRLGLTYEAVIPFASPRRLALRVTQLAAEQPLQTLSRRGPALAAAYDSLGKPTPALLGFAKSCGIEPANLSVIKTDKGDWISFEATTKGAATAQLLPTIMQEAIAALPIVKPMRWGDGDYEFARPVHWLVMVYGDKLIPGEILGVVSGQVSYGHRFHHPDPVFIASPADYESLLHAACVIVDFHKRREIILLQIQTLAKEVHAEAVIPDALLDEVTSIVEWPKALRAEFDKDFLLIPQEVLVASMQAHQKCFPLADPTGKLLPYFITVANLDSVRPAQVILGNEKVMRARLSDAAFFFEQDRKNPLASHIPATEKVIFQAKLGSLHDKAQRLQQGMQNLLAPLQLNATEATRAALLSKCDLLTGMVSEFPLLQGVMGYYYAKLDGESLAVALSLQEQYLPRFAGDDLPKSALGTALSLADRLDTLAGSFLLGEKPSGVKDPFKLRRHALAVARLLVNNQATLSLAALIQKAALNYQESLLNSEKSQLSELHPFILERLVGYYQGQGIKTSLVNAVLARQNDSLFDLNQRLHALTDFVKRPEAEILSAACKRVTNLLNSTLQEAAQINSIDTALFHEQAEHHLFKQLDITEVKVHSLHEDGDYPAILTLLSSLRPDIDVFFEHVMVLVDDVSLKRNRLALLKRLQGLLQSVADMSLI
ncbi:MAG: glycine--tRNA ligase subunit beta [Legionellales bacterium RIFCSPHIGHO2_12_FULL_42_9]|nr:MAG: glycine--tRNA ligase subunit beta [Legionellales bacterium RIFCSPHIGHO2_12_FULL_42_9]